MGRKEEAKGPSREKRLLFLSVSSMVLFLCLLGRLFYLQIIMHEPYSNEVNKQRSLTIPLSSGRGIIYDRNFIPLTDQEEETVAILFPQLFTGNEGDLAFLAQLTGLSPDALGERIPRGGGYPMEFSLQGEIDWRDRRVVNTRGLFILNKKKRYASEGILNHVIGYISTVDKRGMSGLEKSMESYLANQERRSVVALLDGRKRLLAGEAYQVMKGGEGERHLRLTIDYHLQALVEQLLDQRKVQGAVVVSQVDTGDILAMVSRPNFDPNHIYLHLNSQGDELYNKAIQMGFPPGSTFKLVVAAAALEAGVIDPEEVFFCNGAETVGNVQIRCSSHSDGGNGEITFAEAFAQSCNSTLIQVGQRVGAKAIMEMAARMGLGEAVNIGLSEEIEGYLPQGDQLLGPAIGNLSIGQGEIEVTPLQINQLTQIIANDGIKQPLKLLQELVDGHYQSLETFPQGEGGRVLSPEVVSKLQEWMALVMDQGTGKRVGTPLAQLTAGKTGTAQASIRGEEVLHGWFTGYYPRENPQFVITVFIQEGTSGSQSALPIFKEIVEGIQNLDY